jgi:pimeloyl-ACP methyl ester carboxylesterase
MLKYRLVMACHVKRTVSDGPSYALVSDSNSVDTAVVYVHGFLGDAQSTWEELQYNVDRLPKEPFRDVDLFFYDYPAEDNFVHLSAVNLRGFLSQIFPLPPAALLEVHFRDLDWRLHDDPEVITLRHQRPYSRLVLVGHSLGAVVIRRLVADEALTLDSNQVPLSAALLLDAELVLMAPAHLGFQPSGKTALLQLLPFSASILRSALFFRAFSDLQPGCHFLTQLQRETAKMAECFPKSQALQPSILWGETENIVTVGRFDSDSPNAMKYARGKDHVTVCKLTRDYLTPAEVVLRKGLAHGA